jgi:hypothetical protein
VLRAADAAWTIIQGETVALDVLQANLVEVSPELDAFSADQSEGFRVHDSFTDPMLLRELTPPYFGVLQFCWSVAAAIDRDSESMRWMGGMRFDVEGLRKALGTQKRYGAALTMWPSSSHWDEEAKQFHCERTQCLPGCALCHRSADDVVREPLPPVSEIADFSYLIATNLTMLSGKDIGSTCAHFSDGVLDVVSACSLGKADMTKMLLSLESGSFMDNDRVAVRKPWAFLVHPEPGTGQGAREYYSVDGEYPFCNSYQEEKDVPAEWDDSKTAIRVVTLPAHVRLFRGDMCPKFML